MSWKVPRHAGGRTPRCRAPARGRSTDSARLHLRIPGPGCVAGGRGRVDGGRGSARRSAASPRDHARRRTHAACSCPRIPMSYHLRGHGHGHGSRAAASSATAGTPGKRTLTESLTAPAAASGPASAPIQARRVAGGLAAPVAAPSVSGGRPLPEDLRASMERAFGADFSSVRVHEGPHAAAIGAEAFAQGEAIHFAPGRYDPVSAEGRRAAASSATCACRRSTRRRRTPRRASRTCR